MQRTDCIGYEWRQGNQLGYHHYGQIEGGVGDGAKMYRCGEKWSNLETIVRICLTRCTDAWSVGARERY